MLGQILLGTVDQRVGLVACLGELAPLLVFFGVGLGFFDKLLDLFLAESAGGRDLDRLFFARAQILRGHMHDPVGVDVERHLVLVISRRGKDLALLGRDGRIPLDQVREDAAQGLDTQGERRHVQKQHVLDVALQHAALNGRADRHDFVGIHATMRFLAEKFADNLDDLGHSGHAADQHHFVDVLCRHARIGQGFLAGFDGALDQIVNELFQLGPRELGHQVPRPAGVRSDEGQVDLGLLRRRQLDFRPLGGFLEPLKGHPVLAQIDPLVFFELLHQPVHDPEVEIIAAEVGVAVGGLDFEDAVADLQNGDIERPAAEVVDRDALVLLLVETVGQRGGRRFVDDTKHVEAGDLPRVLGGLALAVVEVRRHGDDRLADFLPEIILRRLLHFLENHRRDFRRAVPFTAQLDVRVAVVRLDDFIGEPLDRFLHFSRTVLAPHQPLDGENGVFRVGDGLTLRDLADQPFAFVRDGDNRRSGSTAFRVGDDDRVSAAHDRDAGIGGSKIDADDLTHVRLLPCSKIHCIRRCRPYDAESSGLSCVPVDTLTIAARSNRSCNK